MRVGVITDLVLFERRDYVQAIALFEYPHLFADQLERSFDTQPRQHFSQTLRRIVALRQDVIFGVEPERDVNRRVVGRLSFGGSCFNRFGSIRASLV